MRGGLWVGRGLVPRGFGKSKGPGKMGTAILFVGVSARMGVKSVAKEIRLARYCTKR